MMLRSVDLPQPDGPTRHRNCDCSMSKLTPSTPVTLPEGVSYTSETLRTSMWGIVADGLELSGRSALERSHGPSTVRPRESGDPVQQTRTLSNCLLDSRLRGDPACSSV